MEEQLDKSLIQKEIAKLVSGQSNENLAILNICEIIEVVSKKRHLLEFSIYIEDDFDYNEILFPNEKYIDRYIILNNFAKNQNENIKNIHGICHISDEEFERQIK